VFAFLEVDQQNNAHTRAKAAGAGVQALRSDLARNLRSTPFKDQERNCKLHVATLKRRAQVFA